LDKQPGEFVDEATTKGGQGVVIRVAIRVLPTVIRKGLVFNRLGCI